MYTENAFATGASAVELHFVNMHQLFEGLLSDSHPENEGTDPETFRRLFEFMLLNNVSELVMACTQSEERKIRIIDEALDIIPFAFPIDAATFLQTKASDPSFRALIRDTITSTEQKLGQFWFFILIFGEKTARQEDCLSFAKAYFDMMAAIESILEAKYPNAGFGRIAMNQAMPVIAGMGKAYS